MTNAVWMTVNGVRMLAEQLDRSLKERKAELQKQIAVANKKASIMLYQWVQQNFQTEGGLVGGWADLSPFTWAWKKARGYSRILQNTGALRQSYLPQADAKTAKVGTDIPYATKHEFGEEGLKVRRMLPEPEEVEDELTQIYGFAVQSVARRL